jgi:replicative DNA helicase
MIKPTTIPHSLEAETAILGALLMDSQESVDQCVDCLTENHFYQRAHQAIFVVICMMSQKAEPIDPITVTTRLKDLGKIEEIGGAHYISKLATNFPYTPNLQFFVQVLQEKKILRDIFAVSCDIADKAVKPVEDVPQFVDRVETEIFKVCESNNRVGQVRNLTQVADNVMAKQAELRSRPGMLPGLSWGLHDLDKLTLGLKPGEMVIVAARPGLGKTSLGVQIALHQTLQTNPVPVCFISLEMRAEELFTRIVCAASRVNLYNLSRGLLGEKEVRRFSAEAQRLSSIPLHIIDSGGMSITQIRSAARRLKARENIGLLVVDYLQLMAASTDEATRERQVAAMSNGIKALALELNIPVVALSQFSRDIERRDDKRPRLSDLRDSGSIEQDADMVLLMARAEDGQEIQDAVTIDAVLGKNRNGPTGDVKLLYFPMYTRFENHAYI